MDRRPWAGMLEPDSQTSRERPLLVALAVRASAAVPLLLYRAREVATRSLPLHPFNGRAQRPGASIASARAAAADC